MREKNGTTWALAAALLAAAILSFALVTPWAASAETHEASLTALEEKQSTVLELAAASTAASAAITLLPGDAATPIADKLADISGYFLLALCAIYLEKYLLTVTAYAAFRLLVPAACLLLAAWLLAGRDWLRKAGWKLLVFGLAIVLVIPASVKVSGRSRIPTASPWRRPSSRRKTLPPPWRTAPSPGRPRLTRASWAASSPR